MSEQDDNTGEGEGFKVNGHKLPNLTALFGNRPRPRQASPRPIPRNCPSMSRPCIRP